MSRFESIFRQLKQRRVIRTGVVYAALVWGGLQVADMMAEAELITPTLVRWLIFAGLAGFPVALVTSWFFETPWRDRKRISVIVDVLVILAVATGVFLLGWQQYMASFTRPSVAVLHIEPTDAQPDTPAYAGYIERRFRLALAQRHEIAVTELTSSLSPLLGDRSIPQKASFLRADYLVAGTLNQGDEQLRLNLQLFASDGSLIWSDRYVDHVANLAQLEVRALAELWKALPLPAGEFTSDKQALFDCRHPQEADVVRTMVYADAGLLQDEEAIGALSDLIEREEDTGLLHLSRARVYYRRIPAAPVPHRPVLNNLASQELDGLSALCPDHPEAALLKLQNQGRILGDANAIREYLRGFPNNARAMLDLAILMESEGRQDDAAAFARSAWLIDPLNVVAICDAEQLLRRNAPKSRLEDFLYQVSSAIPDFRQQCTP